MPPGPEATSYGVILSQLATQARSLVRDLDPSNDLTFLRITCKKYEMMIAPDKEFFLIVI
jgi:dynein light chain roadblock-type